MSTELQLRQPVWLVSYDHGPVERAVEGRQTTEWFDGRVDVFYILSGFSFSLPNRIKADDCGKLFFLSREDANAAFQELRRKEAEREKESLQQEMKEAQERLAELERSHK